MRAILFATALGITGSLISAGTVAQTPSEVTVKVTRGVTTKLVGRSPTGVPIKDVSLSYGVSVADLDLASVAGAEELEKRVNDAALAACKEIGRQYPESVPGEAECARTAAKQAMVQGHQLIHVASQATTK